MRRSKTTSSHCICYSVCLVVLACLVFAVVILCTSDVLVHKTSVNKQIPLAINTWPFMHATAVAWDALYNQNLTALDAVEKGCSVCEQEQCDLTVGFGGSPDENGETTLDAFIMDGETMNVGAVAALRNIKSAISVARRVLENTEHSILAGELATQFAINMGFTQESLTTNQSKDIYTQWISGACQPNYWTSVTPDPSKQCGPYRPVSGSRAVSRQTQASHDTISMITIDREGHIAVGTSSNGANHKIPGRVGDAPLVGAGGYADATVGAACCTGDGDVMMRFLPSFLAVEQMRLGVSPGEAARTAISRIARYYPSFSGAIIVASVAGEYAAACHGLNEFPFSVHSLEFPAGQLIRVPCI